MTFGQYEHIARHFSKSFLTIVLVFALAGGVVGTFESRNGKASATLVVSEPTGTLLAGDIIPLTTAIAENIASSANDDEVAVSIENNVTARSIVFNVESSKGFEEAVETATAIAVQTSAEAESLFQEMSSRYSSSPTNDGETTTSPLDAFDQAIISNLSGKDKAAALELVSFTIISANQDERPSAFITFAKYFLLVTGIGLIVASGVTICRGRRLVPDGTSTTEICGLKVIADEKDGCFGERVLTTLFCSSSKPPQTIAIIALTDHDAERIEQIMGSKLDAITLWEQPPTITVCNPPKRNIGNLITAHDADAVLLCATSWKDSLEATKSILDELKLVGANIAGIILTSHYKRD